MSEYTPFERNNKRGPLVFITPDGRKTSIPQASEDTPVFAVFMSRTACPYLTTETGDGEKVKVRFLPRKTVFQD